ncbi:MAG: dihydrolipoamide acetyltransferase, partial [Xanthomonadales bacterium]|nr:dihydrolipoamide acetyltransferase [Xanthomonadales bacterium]
MAERMEVRVPDIGDFVDVPVIEILVQPGDQVSAEQSLLTLESDKATMEVPAPTAGTVVSVEVALNGTVSEGDLVAVLEPLATASASSEAGPETASGATQTVAVAVPDIGDFTDVPVIELLVAVGDMVSAEQSLVTLESDKATMEVPAPVSGRISALKVALNDTVSEGH